MYTVVFTSNSARLYKKVKNQVIKKKIKKSLVKLSKDPHKGKKLTGDLKDQYSIRAWPYRIVYLIQKQTIIILDIGHRKEIYK